jgi:hypothetical protein
MLYMPAIIIFFFLSIITVGSVLIYSTANGILTDNNQYIRQSGSNLTYDSIFEQKSVSGPVLSVYTNKMQYAPGEVVHVFGNVNNGTGGSDVEKVTLAVYDNYINRNNIISNTSSLTNNGSYFIEFNAPKPSNYIVTASLEKWNEMAFTKIASIDPLSSITAYIFYIGLISLILLLVLVPLLSSWSYSISELASFGLISAIVFSPIAALLSSTVELGVDSPLGLILKHPLDENGQIRLNDRGQPELGGEWMVNVGGSKHNNYTDGIQIPIYVITFGIIGGYLRYLYETTKSRRRYIENEIKKIEKETDNEGKKKKIRRFFVFENLKALALIFLAPILAIGVWFVLQQLGLQGQQQSVQGQTGIFVLAAVSFTIGLVTEEAVEYLIAFIKERLGLPQQTGTDTTTSGTKETDSDTTTSGTKG